MSIADKYRQMLQRARNSPHYWAHAARREFQTKILAGVTAAVDHTYKEAATQIGLSTQKYLALLRSEDISLERMSEIAIAQGKRIRITLEPISRSKRK